MVDAIEPDQSFVVNLDTRDDVRECRALLSRAAEQFVARVSGGRIRNIGLPPRYDRASVAEWVLKCAARVIFQNPQETRAQYEILNELKKSRLLEVEEWIDENIRLIGEIKLSG